MEPRIFVGIPTYSGLIGTAAAQTIYTESTIHQKMVSVTTTSLLCYGFNTLWCQALNRRSDGITHFAMLHADIQPQADWLDVLIGEMDKHDADIVSAVVPLKSGQGMTSTAIDTDHWSPRRLTIRETARLPLTFGAWDVPWSGGRALLVNTGCWVCRFTDSWVERMSFHTSDAIERNEAGIYCPKVFPEDWHFSRRAHREELKVMATKAVKLSHIGMQGFPNYGEWGDETDTANGG